MVPNTADKTGGEKRKATFQIDARLHRRLKIHAVVEGRTMTELIEGVLEEYMQKCEGRYSRRRDDRRNGKRDHLVGVEIPSAHGTFVER